MNQQNTSHGNNKRSSPSPPPFMAQVPLNGNKQINGGKENKKLGTCMVRDKILVHSKYINIRA
jgi:hypothetical protein